jgi:subtilisin-like proprotein convertase family protein
MLSVLPLPVITDHYALASSSSGNDNTPTVVVDPLDPNKLVTVYTEATSVGPRIGISYAVLDPTLNSNQSLDPTTAALGDGWQTLGIAAQASDPRPSVGSFATDSDATVAFDHNGYFYVLSLQHSNDTFTDYSRQEFTTGAVVLEKFNFTGATPVAVSLPADTLSSDNKGNTLAKVLYEWDGLDPALNPTIAVDGNAASFTDPTTGAVQSDLQTGTTPTTDKVYVAWTTNSNANQYGGPNNPNIMRIMGSANGGISFTPPELFDGGGDGNGATGGNLTAPQLSISQGTADNVVAETADNPSGQRVPGGQLNIVFDNFGTSGPSDDIVYNNINDGSAAASFISQNSASPGNPEHLIPPANTPQQPDITTFADSTLVVNNAINPLTNLTQFDGFDTITDIQITASVTTNTIGDISLVLIPPTGLGSPIVLLANQIDGLGNVEPGGAGTSGVNLGVVPNGAAVGTVFDVNAVRAINDATQQGTSHIGHFTPEGGTVAYNGATGFSGGTPGGGSLDNLINLATTTNVLGTWRLEIAQYRNDSAAPNAGAPATLNNWSIRFSSKLTPHTDTVIGTAANFKGAASSPFPNKTAASPDRGIAPSPVFALDNTLGSFSPYEGRIYVAYVDQPNGTPSIELVTSDDGGATWQDSPAGVPTSVSNGDVGLQSGRTVMEPAIAVDEATGTLVVTYYDADYDASNARVARFITTSLDGGATFSPVDYLNTPDSATDGITGQIVAPEPLPDNQSSGNAGRDTAVGFGDRQGLAVYDGNVYAVWAGNENIGNLSILSATATIAGGPRIITGDVLGTKGDTIFTSGDMGQVTESRTAGSTSEAVLIDPYLGSADATAGQHFILDPNTNQPLVYDNTFAPDGTRQLDGVVVSFDRPVWIGSFTPDQFQMIFHGPNDTGAGTSIVATSVTPLDSGPYGPAMADADGAFLATTFFIKFAPQSAVGTYSYTVGPNVQDLIRTLPGKGLPTPQGDGTGNKMNQAGDALDGVSTDTNGNQVVSDKFAVPRPLGTSPFQAPYDPNTLPLIIPGPHTVGSYIPGNPIQLDNQVLDSTSLGITVTLPAEIVPGSFTLSKIQKIVGPDGNSVAGPFTITADPTGTAPADASVTFEIGFPSLAAGKVYSTGPYTVYLDPSLDTTIGGGITGGSGVGSGDGFGTDNAVINGKVTAINVVFDRDINPASFTSSSVLQVLGPTGLLTGPFTVTADPAGTAPALAARTFQIGFPSTNLAQLNANGTYTIKLASSITDTFGNALDQNFNAGLSTLEGSSTSDPSIAEYSNTTSTIIQGPQTTSSTIFIPDNFLVQNLKLLLNISYPSDPDLTATLVSPNGTSVVLFSNVGAPNVGNFTNTQFDDSSNPAGTTSIAAGTPPFTGTFITQGEVAGDPTSGLNAFNGLQSGGNWTLNIITSNSATTGTLLNWSLFLPKTQTFHYTQSTAAPIRGPNVTNSVINVPDSFLVQNVTAQLSITYPNDPDLTAKLIAPDGTTVLLFSNVGQSSGSKANFTDTIFDDSASTNITQASAPFFSTFQTEDVGLSALNLLQAHGAWTLQITSSAAGVIGSLVNWSLTLEKKIALSGLGEPVSDQPSLSFRTFTESAQNPISSSQFTAVGGAASNNSETAGSVSNVVADPSDPSGNTVFVAGSNGGVWKTTNFLTTNPNGPTYLPLTDSGPTYGLNISSLAVFPRNNQTSQSIVFAGTGSFNSFNFIGDHLTTAGNGNSPGVGILRSLDGGLTWQLLESSSNVDANGNELSSSSTQRDHIFVGQNITNIVVDPRLSVDNQVIVYVSVTGTHGGIYRSIDGGNHWTLVKQGQATDVILDPTNYPDAVSLEPGNFNYVYAAFTSPVNTGDATGGIYFSPNQGTLWNEMLGGIGNPNVITGDNGGSAVPILSPGNPTPNVDNGTILIAKPSFVGNQVLDTLYQGWLFAVVVTPVTPVAGSTGGGSFDGLYVTKDFGRNWTKVRLPVVNVDSPSDNPANPDYNVLGGQGRYDVSLAVDPVNPNIVYIGGASSEPSALIRVDVTAVEDGHALYVAPGRDDGGQTLPNMTDDIKVTTYNSPFPTPVIEGGNANNVYGPHLDPAIPFPYVGLPNNPYQFLNFATLGQDPADPFQLDSIVSISDVTDFNNTGTGALWSTFDINNGGRLTNVHQVYTYIDQVTGKARLIFATDTGVYTGVDDANGTVGGIWSRFQSAQGTLLLGVNNLDGDLSGGIGASITVNGQRNGNLQLAQFFSGAVQPSLDAAIKGASLFYANGNPGNQQFSDPQILSNGNLNWTAQGGSGNSVATDSTGTGTAYWFNFPCCNGEVTGFFQVTPPGGVETARTFGLLQASNPGDTPDPQWPSVAGSNFAVNPINGNQIVISSQTGNYFETSNEGEFWVQIGDPTSGVLDGQYAGAFAWGAPDPSAPLHAPESEFIYAGTDGGHVFVTFTGGGGSTGNQWKNISTGLDGSSVRQIIADPVRGTHDAYAVTFNGVYYLADATAANPTWVNITGNLFSLTDSPFNDPLFTEQKLKYLETIAVDWRSNIPNAPGFVNGQAHPTLYVAGAGGVYRSLTNGATWTIFPSISDGAQVTGGLLPNTVVTDLNLSVGDIDPATGIPLVNGQTNLLVATTFGRGTFAIRVASAPIATPSAPQLVAADDNGASSSDHVTSVTQPHFTGTGLADATIQLFANGVLVGTTTADGSGNYTVQVSAPLATGVYQITARQIDVSGEISAASSAMNPELVIVSGSGQFPISAQGYTINVQQQAFVTALYQDALGRAPGAGEITLWTNALAAGNSRQSVATAIITSDEARTILISSDYQKLLGRNPTSAEIASQLAFLKSGQTDEQLLAVIIGSSEYFGRVGSTNTGFVQQAYQDLLGRAPTANEFAVGVNTLNARTSRQSFAFTLTATTEYKTDVIQANFQKYLSRAASAAEVTNYLNLKLTDEKLIAALAGSDEFYNDLVINGQSITVATFTDTNPAGQLSDYQATIDWGQGDVLAGTVSAIAGGGFAVSGIDPLTLTSTQKVVVSVISLADGSAATVTTKLLVGTINSLFVSGLYQDLLGRAADATGLAYFTDLLNRGASRQQVAQIIMSSNEYHQLQVISIYQTYLHRAADSVGLADFSNALSTTSSLEQVTATILGSDEFYNDVGNTNAAFLNALYSDVLGRPIDPTGQAAFTNALNGGATRAQVALAILTSNEYRLKMVQSFYVQFLHRQGSLNELEGWVSLMQGGATVTDVISGIVGSDEYLGNL